MTSTPQLEFNRSIVGMVRVGGTFPVTRGDILRYCRSVGDVSPLSTDEAAAKAAGYPALVAPPSFCTVLVQSLKRPDVGLRFGRTGLHSGETLEVHAPVYAGDTLTVLTTLKEVYLKTGRSGTMAFTVWENDFLNQRGELVARVQDAHVRMP